MKVKINLYFDTASGVINWRIITKKDKLIYTSVCNFSGTIESSHSFQDHRQAQNDAIRFCRLVGIDTACAEFFDKQDLQKPEITK
jgi:hypothetical protein